MANRIHAVTMPKWGMTMTDGKVVEWLAKEGQSINTGMEFLEIETTKITNVVEAPVSGMLRRCIVDAGRTVPVGTLLGVIAGTDATDSEVDDFVAGYAPVVGDGGDADASGDINRIVEAGGHRLNLATLGNGGQHMVLIHGFGGDLNSWMFNQPDLANTFTVHAVDLPGHGRSSLTVGSGSVPDLAAGMISLLDTLGIDEAHLVGHSLGGAIALFLAIKHADRVSSLSLICPGGLGAEINLDFIDGFIAADRRKQMVTVLGNLFADPTAVQRKMVEESLKYKRLDGVAGALQAIRQATFADTGQAGGMREALVSMKVPVQVIWGAEDRIIPASHMDGLPVAIQTHLISQAGHMPHMEKAGEVNRLIAEFAGRTGG